MQLGGEAYLRIPKPLPGQQPHQLVGRALESRLVLQYLQRHLEALQILVHAPAIRRHHDKLPERFQGVRRQGDAPLRRHLPCALGQHGPVQMQVQIDFGKPVFAHWLCSSPDFFILYHIPIHLATAFSRLDTERRIGIVY